MTTPQTAPWHGLIGSRALACLCTYFGPVPHRNHLARVFLQSEADRRRGEPWSATLKLVELVEI
jgi:hypothetical protein